MKVIKYHNRLEHYAKETYEDDYGRLKQREILSSVTTIPLEYICSDDKLDYWLSQITETYGKYGDVIYETILDTPTPEELQRAKELDILKNAEVDNITLKELGYKISQEKLNSMKKDAIINHLGKELSRLKLELLQVKGGK